MVELVLDLALAVGVTELLLLCFLLLPLQVLQILERIGNPHHLPPPSLLPFQTNRALPLRQQLRTTKCPHSVPGSRERLRAGPFPADGSSAPSSRHRSCHIGQQKV